MNVKITGSGSSIPQQIQNNSGFSQNSFYDAEGNPISNPNEEIIEKFKAITGIEQRRYIKNDETVIDIAIVASNRAIEDAKVDPETLDYIIVATTTSCRGNQVLGDGEWLGPGSSPAF